MGHDSYGIEAYHDLARGNWAFDVMTRRLRLALP